MARVIDYFISHEFDGASIDFFLRGKGYSRHMISVLKRIEKGIVVRGNTVFSTFILREGDILNIKMEEETESENIDPVEMDIDIIFEDEDIIVINKCSDMPVHPSIGNYNNTLANGLAYYFKNKNEKFVFRAISRLDRNTTGLVLIAKNKLASGILSEMSKRHDITKEYLAVVKGLTPVKGVIDAPIGRVEGSIIKRGIDYKNGDKAITHYERMDYQRGCSLVKILLETGRTHQIRVHMGYIGFPLMGDFLYYDDYSLIERQALHSRRLELTHPINGEKLVLIAPIPDDINNIFK